MSKRQNENQNRKEEKVSIAYLIVLEQDRAQSLMREGTVSIRKEMKRIEKHRKYCKEEMKFLRYFESDRQCNRNYDRIFKIVVDKSKNKGGHTHTPCLKRSCQEENVNRLIQMENEMKNS